MTKVEELAKWAAGKHWKLLVVHNGQDSAYSPINVSVVFGNDEDEVLRVVTLENDYWCLEFAQTAELAASKILENVAATEYAERPDDCESAKGVKRICEHLLSLGAKGGAG